MATSDAVERKLKVLSPLEEKRAALYACGSKTVVDASGGKLNAGNAHVAFQVGLCYGPDFYTHRRWGPPGRQSPSSRNS